MGLYIGNGGGKARGRLHYYYYFTTGDVANPRVMSQGFMAGRQADRQVP